MVANLTAMGFPEAEVKACLRASQGNPDIAVEYLMNGIPPFVQELANAATPTPTSTNAASTTNSSTEPLAALRNHPQINDLRRLVQANPATLQQVLTQIGQQQPDLLREINSNQELFLQIMNEPVGTGNNSSSSSVPAAAPSHSSPTVPSSNRSGVGGIPGMEGMMDNPAQMAQMIQGMNPEQLRSMATMMGMTPEQLTATAQMISQMPPEDFQNFLAMAMNQEGRGGGAGNMMDQDDAPPGAQVVRLTAEEMESVNRLTEMGFDRNEAAQAYLACDKNEALAANLLMDGGWGDVNMGGGGGGNDGNNDGDDMYD